MTASGGLEEFQDGGLEGKPFITTAFFSQEILLFVYLLNDSDMSFKTVPVIIWRFFFWLEELWVHLS